jgi:hypothetical protein
MIHTCAPSKIEQVEKVMRDAIYIGDEPVKARPLVFGRVTPAGIYSSPWCKS